jgi:selenocysteine-specific elongation factor
MNTGHFIVATAGHVDHGKSALVKALTGIDPDRLPEEKTRGITIDLGFAHLELPSTINRVGSGHPSPSPLPSAGEERVALAEAPAGPGPSTFDLGIVDVPGHEDFVKNMVAGVGSIDLALFVVAADDGWMPQTEEHLQILTYLGVTRAVVALTKIDLVPDEAVRGADIRAQLRDSPFSQAPIIPTSVVTGRGLDDLKAALARVLAQTPPPRDIGKPRLPVDRVFTLRGIGTVVTGTLSGGVLHRGQNVVIQPSAKTTRIRSLQNHNRDVEATGPGTRAALNLPDVEGSGSPAGVGRGEVVTLLELGRASHTMDVALEKSARLAGAKAGAARPLKDGTLVRVHWGSANVAARVHLLDGGPLLPGERKLAQLRFDSPVFAFAGDHFIIRDWSEQATLAGGVILDPDASRVLFRSETRRNFLRARADSTGDVSAFVVSQLARDRAVPRSGLLAKSRFSAAEIAEAVVGRLAGKAVLQGEWLFDATWWEQLRQKAVNTIDAGHRAHPERPGLNLTELRAVLEKELCLPEVFNALLADLYRNGFSQVGVAIRRTTHRPALPPHLQAAGATVRAALSAKPMDPPSRKELAPDSLTQQALRFLVQTGEAVDLDADVVLLAESYARATETIRKLLHARGSATASELRQALGTSRRIVIPLLERLDKEGVTRRDGDRRTLRQDRTAGTG